VGYVSRRIEGEPRLSSGLGPPAGGSAKMHPAAARLPETPESRLSPKPCQDLRQPLGSLTKSRYFNVACQAPPRITPILARQEATLDVRKEAEKSSIEAKAIGHRLREFRNRRGLSQAKLGGMVGLTQTLVSDYEIGRLRLNAGLVIRFAKALHVTADELLGLKPSKENGFFKDRRFIRRLQEIETLSRSEKQVLLKTIDHFLRGARPDRSA
jgi:transcriptional regulator with XRE-family HTH domain